MSEEWSDEPMKMQYDTTKRYTFNYEKFKNDSEYSKRTIKALEAYDGQSIMLVNRYIAWLLVDEKDMVMMQRSWLDERED